MSIPYHKIDEYQIEVTVQTKAKCFFFCRGSEKNRFELLRRAVLKFFLMFSFEKEIAFSLIGFSL